jgi:hypothetical protein
MFGKGADELITHYLDKLALRLPIKKIMPS